VQIPAGQDRPRTAHIQPGPDGYPLRTSRSRHKPPASDASGCCDPPAAGYRAVDEDDRIRVGVGGPSRRRRGAAKVPTAHGSPARTQPTRVELDRPPRPQPPLANPVEEPDALVQLNGSVLLAHDDPGPRGVVLGDREAVDRARTYVRSRAGRGTSCAFAAASRSRPGYRVMRRPVRPW
jgi:hypothetical protein